MNILDAISRRSSNQASNKNQPQMSHAREGQSSLKKAISVACVIFACLLISYSSYAKKGFVMEPSLLGKWEVRNTAMGAGKIYVFRSDGTYVYIIFRILPGRVEPIQSETGDYSVRGNYLTLEPEGDDARTYQWEITRDRYVGDRILWLKHRDGLKEQFYGSR